MSWIAELDTHGMEFPTCVHVTKTTNTMTHGATYVPIEDGKVVREENAKLREEVVDLRKSSQTYESENAKLRELVKDLYDIADTYMEEREPFWWEPFDRRMGELGIEVDG